MLKASGAVVALSTLFVSAAAGASSWEFDPSHSNASFSVRHLMVANVRGDLGKVSGAVDLDDKDITKSIVTASIDASGINTRDQKRDAHLKSAEFLDVEKFPAITFKSKKVAKAGADKLKVTGDLTIKGVTQEVVLDVDLTKEIKDGYGNVKRGAVATTKLDRTAFGLKWNMPVEGGGVLVGNEVNVTLDLELQKKVEVKKT